MVKSQKTKLIEFKGNEMSSAKLFYVYAIICAGAAALAAEARAHQRMRESLLPRKAQPWPEMTPRGPKKSKR